ADALRHRVEADVLVYRAGQRLCKKKGPVFFGWQWEGTNRQVHELAALEPRVEGFCACRIRSARFHAPRLSRPETSTAACSGITDGLQGGLLARARLRKSRGPPARQLLLVSRSHGSR